MEDFINDLVLRNNLVLVKYINPKETESGLIIGDNTKNRNRVSYGKVLKVGSDVTLFKKDDIVLYNFHTEVPITNEYHIISASNDILGGLGSFDISILKGLKLV